MIAGTNVPDPVRGTAAGLTAGGGGGAAAAVIGTGIGTVVVVVALGSPTVTLTSAVAQSVGVCFEQTKYENVSTPTNPAAGVYASLASGVTARFPTFGNSLMFNDCGSNCSPWVA